MTNVVRRVWGQAAVAFGRGRRFPYADLAILFGIAGFFFGLVTLGREWTGALRPTVEIDLSPWALPKYALFSLSRGLTAYVLSLAFTFVYGYWAARDKIAERLLVPLLDILQSIPVLGFMPGLVLALISLFPGSNVGLELAAIAMIFTGQAWNLTFSFYHSLKSVPQEFREAARLYRFSAWQRVKWVEVPYAVMGLVWNSMMSMAGGWFFLMVSESFVLGDRDFRLPGIGSYMSAALAKGDVPAMIGAVVAMVAMIVALDQFLWRPVVVWSQKFRVEEGGAQEAMSSWFLEWLRRSRLLRLWRRVRLLKKERSAKAAPTSPAPARSTRSVSWSAMSIVAFVVLVALMGIGAWKLVVLLIAVPSQAWTGIVVSAGLTLGRVLLSTAIGTLWALPAGLAIGLSPKWSRVLQPAVQVAASFPAPMLFPIVIGALHAAGVPLGWGSIVLMLLGTQWYILFNVVAGSMAIPADLREAAKSYHYGRAQRFRDLYFPAVFPYLVTGWVTAAGGAWNASIVAEIVSYKGQVLSTRGLGAEITRAAAAANFPLLAASVVVMSAVVVLFNHAVWRRLYQLAETRFSLSK
jgi:NitT/TauT family transport system permease protein